ncbi:MAG: hypothetical protein ACRBCI_14340 [Cellvibrionaceae bacterium]
MTQELSVEQKAHLGRIAAKQFLSITDKWQLTDDERRILAGAATRTTISTWRKRVKKLEELQLGNDTYERLICIANIERSLEHNQIPEPDDIAALIREPKDDLGYHSLLENMLNGKVIDLYQTKDYIDQKRCIETPL